MFWFGDSNIVIISGLSKTLAFFYYIILALAKLKLFKLHTTNILTIKQQFSIITRYRIFCLILVNKTRIALVLSIA